VHACLLLPDLEGLYASAPIAGGGHEMAPWSEVAVDHSVRRQEALCLVSRLELLHLPLSSSRGAMRVLSPVVQVPARPVSDVRQHRSLSNAIAPQAIRDQASWLVLHPVQQMLEEALGSGTVPPVLHQNVQHDAVLIDGAPQIVQHPADANEYLIQMPGISGLGASSAQPSGKVSTELQAPVPNALVGHHDAALSQDEFHIPQAETENMMEPHGVADDLCREAMPRIRDRVKCHSVSFARLQARHQTPLTCQYPSDP
jgi:hypothetical protein